MTTDRKSNLPSPIVLHGDVLAPGEPAFFLRGYCYGAPREEGYDTIDEARSAARYAVEDNTWCPVELRNASGDVLVCEDRMCAWRDEKN